MKRVMLAVMVLGAGVAHADSNPKPQLEAGVTVGSDRLMSHEAIAAGGALQLSSIWAVHAEVAQGRADNSLSMSTGPNVYYSARIGPEARLCRSHAVCAFAGADLGLITESYKIGQAETDVLGTWNEIEERGGFALFPRVGLDLGEGHWRFRPSAEATLSTTLRDGNAGNSDLIGMAAKVAIAYQW